MRSAFVLLAAAACCLSPAASRADLVVEYTITFNAPTVSPTNGVGAVGINMARGAGLGTPAGAFDFLSNGWDGEATDYVEFGFDTTDAFDAALTQLRFRASRDATGPPFMTVQVSFDNFATPGIVLGASGLTVSTTPTNYSFDLSAFDEVDSARFRIFGSGAVETGVFALEDDGNFSGGVFGDLLIEGTFFAVPEASSFLFGGLIAGILGLGYGGRALWRRKPLQSA